MRITACLLILAIGAPACADSSIADADPTATTTPPATTAPPTTEGPTTLSTLSTSSTSSTSSTTTSTLDPNLPDVAATATITAGAVATETPKIEAAVGHTVEITVTSDVADELHIHGYDLFADLEPGVAVTLRFEADIPGIFEVELEGAHLAVFSLEVS